MGIVEKCVVAIPPGEGLWGESRQVTPIPPLGLIPLPALPQPLEYLGADAEVVVGDELLALVVASMHPAVEGAEGHAGQG